MVETAIQQTHDTLFKQNIIPWKFHPRNSEFEPTRTENRTYIHSIVLVQTASDEQNVIKPVEGQVNESYTLNIRPDGHVLVHAASAIGLSRAMTTFVQLFFAHSAGVVYTSMAPVSIGDRPKFVHRGLNMDVARSYYPVRHILRTIDALAFTKMNRLHLHITDAQSWPLVIPSMPELSAKGAYQSSLVYTPQDLRNMQHYGALRGVEVYIEIDTPGHTASMAYSHPDLIAACDRQPEWSKYAVEPPSGTLKLNSSEVYNVMWTLLQDILPRVEPYTSLFHTGGDEVNFNAYLLDETVRSNDSAIIRGLLQSFANFNHATVRASGLTPIVWQDMLLTYNLTLGKDVIIQSWRGGETVARIVAAGHRAIAGDCDYWVWLFKNKAVRIAITDKPQYLDCGRGQWLDFEPGEESEKHWPYRDYCSPRKSWRVMYSYNPLRGVPAGLEHLVLGAETSIWSEQTDGVNLDGQVWPRTCAAAEVLWSGPTDASGGNRSQPAASPRLAEMRERLVARGVAAEPMQMPFCTMNGTRCIFSSHVL